MEDEKVNPRDPFAPTVTWVRPEERWKYFVDTGPDHFGSARTDYCPYERIEQEES